jgi:hypothetical protein
MRVAHVAASLLATLALLVTGCQSSEPDASPAATSAAPAGPGTVTVSWAAPVENEDGTPLVDLAGFRLRHGSKYGAYTSEITINNPGATSERVSGLAPGLHYFVVSAIDREGQEGTKSKPQRILVN